MFAEEGSGANVHYRLCFQPGRSRDCFGHGHDPSRLQGQIENMKFEKWSLITESVGTIAIVASLMVLVFQIRENTEATRIASFDAVTQSFNDWRNFMVENPEVGELYFNYKNGVIPSAEKEGLERRMLGAVLVNLFTDHDRAYLAYRSRLDSDEWDRIRRGMCSDRDELLGANDDELRRSIYRLLTSEFVAYMEAHCD